MSKYQIQPLKGAGELKNTHVTTYISAMATSRKDVESGRKKRYYDYDVLCHKMFASYNENKIKYMRIGSHTICGIK